MVANLEPVQKEYSLYVQIEYGQDLGGYWMTRSNVFYSPAQIKLGREKKEPSMHVNAHINSIQFNFTPV